MKGNFSKTLKVIQEILNENLDKSTYKSVRVEGSNSPGKTSILFIFFKRDNSGYEMELAHFKNFRMWRPDGDATEENAKIADLINALKKEILLKYLN